MKGAGREGGIVHGTGRARVVVLAGVVRTTEEEIESAVHSTRRNGIATAKGVVVEVATVIVRERKRAKRERLRATKIVQRLLYLGAQLTYAKYMLRIIVMKRDEKKSTRRITHDAIVNR